MFFVKNDETTEANSVKQDQVRLLLFRKDNANGFINFNFVRGYDTLKFTKFQIKETDLRVKTATFSSPTYVDLTTGQYCILLLSPYHENFGGVILSVEYDEDNELYDYQCQDWSRQWLSKTTFNIPSNSVDIYHILWSLLTRNGLEVSKKYTMNDIKKLGYSHHVSGLRPAYQYYEPYWGGSLKINTMTMKQSYYSRDLTNMEQMRTLIYGNTPLIDLHVDEYGVVHFDPIHVNDFTKGLIELPFEITTNRKFKFDVTNVISRVNVDTGDLSFRKYLSEDLLGLDLSAFVGSVSSTIQKENSTTTIKSNKKSSNTSKTSTTSNKNTYNPYGKKKICWVQSDNINGKSSDLKFIKDFAKKLRKKGWKVKVIGVGSNLHSEIYANVKNGIWFCIYGGACAGTIRETYANTSYRRKIEKNNSRTVLGFRPPSGDIRKGGKYYKWLPRAHDDNFSPSSFRGISYPSKYLTKKKVPFMYASSVDEMVAKFIAGGDNPDAC